MEPEAERAKRRVGGGKAEGARKMREEQVTGQDGGGGRLRKGRGSGTTESML